MDDASRRALRDLARRAEWRGQAGAAGAAQDAGTLRELGAELRAALARAQEQDQEGASSAWSRQSIERLAAYCLKARADWTPEQIAELARLREDAVIALAPGPGESDALPARDGRAALANLGSRQARLVALAVVGCLLLVVVLFLVPHFFSGNGGAQPVAAASTSAAPVTSTTAAAATDSAAPTTSPSATAATSTSSSPSSATTTSNSHVTAIQINSTTPGVGSPPQVILNFTVTASGTDDVLINTTVNGSLLSPSQINQPDPLDESGSTTYSNVTETVFLSQWCGKTVTIAISSGSVSQPFSVLVTC